MWRHNDRLEESEGSWRCFWSLFWEVQKDEAKQNRRWEQHVDVLFSIWSGWVERRQRKGVEEAFRLLRYSCSSCHFLRAAASPAASPASASHAENRPSVPTVSWRVLLFLPPPPPPTSSCRPFSTRVLEICGRREVSSLAGGGRKKIKSKNKQVASTE